MSDQEKPKTGEVSEEQLELLDNLSWLVENGKIIAENAEAISKGRVENLTAEEKKDLLSLKDQVSRAAQLVQNIKLSFYN